MKTLTVLCLLLVFNAATTDIIGTYQIESKSSFDTLTLKSDGTYTYLSRGDSCWTWRDLKGKWELKEDILTLHYNDSFTENVATYTQEIKSPTGDIVVITVKDNAEKPMVGFDISYAFEGDTQTKKTDKNGIVIFQKKLDVTNENKSARILFTYETSKGTHNESRNIEVNFDTVSININSRPKTIHEKKEYTFSYKNGVLKSIKSPHFTSDRTHIYKKL